MNINLVEILKDCPKGTKLYSALHGSVNFIGIDPKDDKYPIEIEVTGENGIPDTVYTSDGRLYYGYNGECILFPSKDQRDWSKWKCPKKPKFDPKTLQPFDRVLARVGGYNHWTIDLFSHVWERYFVCVGGHFNRCIPYNDDTKHLVGTNNEEPEYYRYWED